MSAIDKNQAIISYLLQCPSIQNKPLYFNFINAQDDTTQLIPLTEDTATGRKYVDGSIAKTYIANLVIFKSISDMAIVKTDSVEYPNENIEDMQDVQLLMDWINEQDDLYNFPDFGSDCIVEHIQTTTYSPRLDGVNVELTPPLGMYSVSIQVDYIDQTKILWK